MEQLITIYAEELAQLARMNGSRESDDRAAKIALIVQGVSSGCVGVVDTGVKAG